MLVGVKMQGGGLCSENSSAFVYAGDGCLLYDYLPSDWPA